MKAFVSTHIEGKYLSRSHHVGSGVSKRRVNPMIKTVEEEWRWFRPQYALNETPPIVKVWSSGRGWLMVKNRDDKMKSQIKNILTQSVEQQHERYSALVKKKVHKDTLDFLNGVISFSADGIEGKTNEQLFECAEDFLAKLSERLCGAKPLYLSLHLDETVPHFHFVMENVGLRKQQSRPGQKLKDGQKPTMAVTASRLLCKREFEKIQDLVGECFKPIGLRRGVSAKESHAKYRTVREGHKIAIGQLQEQREAMEKNLEAQEKEIKAKTVTISSLNDRMSDLGSQVAERERSINELDKKIETKKKEVETQKKEIEANRSTIDMQTLTIESGIAEARRRIKDEEERKKKEMKKSLEEFHKARKEKFDQELAESRQELTDLNEKIKITKESLTYYGGSVGLAEAVTRYEAYIYENNLNEDFEDWAAAYAEAQIDR